MTLEKADFKMLCFSEELHFSLRESNGFCQRSFANDALCLLTHMPSLKSKACQQQIPKKPFSRSSICKCDRISEALARKSETS